MSTPKSKSNRVIDLVVGKNGEYEPKRVHIQKPNKTSSFKHFIPTKYKNEQPYEMGSGADEFLNGVDIGIDFINKVVPRVERFFKLKNEI